MCVDYYAHTPNAQGQWHGLVEHLRSTAEQARAFAERFGAGELAYYAGLCHDLGKFHPEFQRYLCQCAAGQSALKHPHAIYGAKLIETVFSLLAYPIAGHHSGMPNKSDLKARLQKFQDLPSILSVAQTHLPELIPLLNPNTPLQLPPHFPDDLLAWEMLTRMLFSCLVDADFLDTERHFDPNRASQRGQTPTLQELWRRFETNQRQLLQQAPDTPINRARRAIYDSCLCAAKEPPGLYRLTAPTGGGKTRAALGFALKHALTHGLERIIVALPYTSIIDQTAQVYREILGEEAVLEHHSALQWDNLDEDATDRWKLLSENWDAPLIVTTFVQLFESLFSNRPSACRKVHHLARSVIVLDEAQTLPTHLLLPTTHALQQLVDYFGTTVVVCTATQPALERLGFCKLLTEIVQTPHLWFEALKRVEYIRESDAWDYTALAQRIANAPQVMVVLNTRRDAVATVQVLREAYPCLEGMFHLSTLLCPAHRRQVLQTVRQRLQNGEPCRLIATQVVEAGVDLDFPVVMRAIGPLDRIVQAAGRCNREGRLERGQVILFELDSGGTPRGAYRTATDEARVMLQRPETDLHDPETYRLYFERLFQSVNTDPNAIQGKRKGFQFKQVADHYRMIEGATEMVVIFNYAPEAVNRLLEEARGRLQAGSLLPLQWYRQIQQYAVNLYCHELRTLEGQGLVHPLPELGLWLYTGDYDALLGVRSQADPADLVV
ncbi:MAG: CRISPR-associated helicase/endonuclease Cas3 [Fimbriimonadales bacterium]|nr:MAG: CRISPR-associated helicase/endonuclease Cas3 [Fimbriimonadales bacterium]